jgi:hypothetical protein
MSRTWIVATLALSLALAACSSRTTTSSLKSPSPPAPASPTAPPPTPTPVPVPEKPPSFGDYGAAVARYLSADAAAASTCLSALYAAWKMPLLSAADGCMLANTDGDPEKEVVAVLSTKLRTPTALSDTQYEIAVFDPTPLGYRVAYESSPADVVPPGRTQPITPLLAAGDLNKDGGGELAYSTGSCGASTCTDTVHILKGTELGYVALTPPDGISMSFAELKFEDTDGDGSKELIMTGGTAGSAGAGPQRARTEVWAWDGASYALRSTKPEQATYLYQAVKDADQLFTDGQYQPAEVAYATAVNDKNLKVWMEEKNERNELESYALFRAGLAVLLANGERVTAIGYLDRAKAYANTLHAQLAASFEAGYSAKSSISVGCAAVRDDIAANLSEYQQFWNFGYSNPEFNPDTVCPF